MEHLGKQYSPICDGDERGVPSRAILFAHKILSKNGIKFKITPECPLKLKWTQSIRHLWVKQTPSTHALMTLAFSSLLKLGLQPLW